MAINIADQYYLKALDNYPYDLEEAIENISYSLSYDDSSAKAHCLMGKIQSEQMKNWAEAEYHFEQAISNDYTFVETYVGFSDLLIRIRSLKKAEKLLVFASKIKGINRLDIYFKLGIIHEMRSNYKIALSYYKKALMENYFDEDYDEIAKHIERIEQKISPNKEEETSSKEKKKKKGEN